MSELHVRQIRASIEKLLKTDVDMSDVDGRPDREQADAFLTRGLAAVALGYIGTISLPEAAKALTDGFQDNGLDAVYYHPSERILYLVQAKWHHDGVGTIELGDMQKFLKGLRDLLNARWDRFNHKVSGRSKELDDALDDARTRIALLIAYTGQANLSQEVSQGLNDVLSELNDPSELITYHVLRQGDVYAAVTQGLSGAPIDLDVTLYDWGQAREPYVGFYGQVSAGEIADWYAAYQSRLFAPNIRMFLGSTEVNETIQSTLLTSPKDFWYFNNGITALCRTVKKKPLGGTTRETGVFECADLRIVNGAQTVGAIAQAAAKDKEKIASARVALRLISLEQCPPQFDKLVTRYTNTQNRIERRDFVALDPEHDRIKGELLIEGVTYVYKSGDTIPSTEAGFDLVEATIARACSMPDLSIAVQAKREIGKLWDNIDAAPYKTLFNPSVSGPSIWRIVLIVRHIEKVLASLKTRTGRERLVAVHGNRFIEHMTILSLPNIYLDDRKALPNKWEQKVTVTVNMAFDATLAAMNKRFPEAYVGSVFKNGSKCQLLKDDISGSA
jgi:hypothetical protein